MLSDAFPPDFPATNALIHLFVEDVDSAYARALNAGATAIAEPADQFFGDRIAAGRRPRWQPVVHRQPHRGRRHGRAQ